MSASRIRTLTDDYFINNPADRLYEDSHCSDHFPNIPSVMGSTAAETFAEKYHSQPNRIKIAHVGAGAAGLITAYKASKFLRDYDLVVYDKLVTRLQLVELATITTLQKPRSRWHLA